MKRAAEKAAECLDAKQAAAQEGNGGASGGPFTPDLPQASTAAQRSMAQRLSVELEAAQKGQAAAHLHTAQLAEMGRM